MKISVAGRETFVYTGARDFNSRLPTVLFMHGAGNDHSVWMLQSRYFAHHGFNALAFDLPGHGRSEGEALSSIAAIADWTASALDALGVPSAAWVGHSMGALAALEAAARHPSRVDRLALVAIGVPMPVSQALLDTAKANDPLACALITGWSFSPAHQLGGNPQPGMWMTGNGARLLERSGPGVLYAGLRACNDYADGLAAAAAVRCPTLLVLGERDLMAPRRNTVALAEALAGRQIVVLAGCSHALMSEAPDAALDALRSFVDASGASSGASDPRAARPASV